MKREEEAATELTPALKAAVAYFRPPDAYFWRWADDGQVIEWKDGSTLCYREEVVGLLMQFSPLELPPLGSVLLVLAACQPEQQAKISGSLAEVHRLLADNPVNTSDEHTLVLLSQVAVTFTEVISRLPVAYRTGNRRLPLLACIFENTKNRLSEQQSSDVLWEFNSGAADELVFHKSRGLTVAYFTKDLTCLAENFKYFSDTQTLENKLRTGLATPPQPADLTLPEADTRPLFDILADDPQTAPLARLARHLLAALRIPLHAQGSHDLPIGGVSDLTNRGTLDKLLLSELAYDDLTLTARLANSEALYLRREEPPAPLSEKRVILVDTTIRLWGTPRVFALASALGCLPYQKPFKQVQAFALAGTTHKALDLTSKDGILNALEYLDPALDCTIALESFFQKIRQKDDTEYIFITEEAHANTADFQLWLHSAETPLRFLITVNREGNLKLYECRKGKVKLVSQSLADLDALLFPVQKPTQAQIAFSEDVPAFWRQPHAPLLFPTPSFRLSPVNTWVNEDKSVLCITQTQRVLYWKAKNKGATELLSFIEEGNYCFGSDQEDRVFIVVHNANQKLFKLYKINFRTGESTVYDFSAKISAVEEVVFDRKLAKGYAFYVRAAGKWHGIDSSNGLLIFQTADLLPGFQPSQLAVEKIDFSEVKKHINNGYSTLSRVKHVYFNAAGRLCFDKYELSEAGLELRLLKSNPKAHQVAVSEEDVTLKGLPNHPFRAFTWKEGSRILVDSKGFFHFKSSDPSLPEFTLTALVSKQLTGWTVGGFVSGNLCFVLSDQESLIYYTTFYENYIRRFINIILSHGTTTDPAPPSSPQTGRGIYPGQPTARLVR